MMSVNYLCHVSYYYCDRMTSVTRFGEISPPWHNGNKLGQFWNGSFRIWQNFYIILVIFEGHEQILTAVKGQNLSH